MARLTRLRAKAIGVSAAERLRQESFDVLLLVGTTCVLVVVGIVMVFSSSTVTSLVENGDSFLSVGRHFVYSFVGLGAMLVLSTRPEQQLKRAAWIFLGSTCALQFLVISTPLGVTVAGNTNWLSIGGLQFQPSEFMKVALVVWLGMMVSRKAEFLGDFRRGLLPILIGAVVSIGLVLLGGDLGTVLVMAAFVFGALILIGIPFRQFILPGIVFILVSALMAVNSTNRLTRILSFFDGSADASDYLSGGWQVQHGQFALANGGLFGVGIGNSTAKWSWLPAADNDFIFAIIGEELGLIGAIVVLFLFGLLGYALIRVFLHATTPFGRTATAAVLVWILVQATANIAVVLGIIPVLGVPLPLVSAGGTALVSTLLAIGIAASVARNTARSHRDGRVVPE